MKRVFIVSALLFSTSSLNAQILECRAVNDANLSVQYAKYKSEKLRSADGTVYEKGAHDHTKDMTYYSAITNKGIEKIWLSNKPVIYKGIEVYSSSISVEFKNGMTGGLETICYDLLKMNKKRVSDGIDPSPVAVSDF